MTKLKKDILSVLVILTALFGVSLTAGAATAVTADFNNGLPEGWTTVGNVNIDGDRARSGKGVWSNGKSATDNYLVTEAIEGTLSLYWRSYGASSSYPNGVLYIYKYNGNALGDLITQTSPYKSSTWKQETFDLGTYKGQVAIALYSACIDDVTYTKSEGSGDDPGPGTDPDPDPDPVPVMNVTPTVVHFGQVTEDVSQTITVSNTGNAELVATITSDNTTFVVSPASLTVEAGASATFTITCIYNAEAYGAHTANITVTPNVGEAVTIQATASIKDPNAWSEDFEGNALPEGWTMVGTGWTFADGMAKGKFEGYDSWLVTPKLDVKDGELMTFQAMSYQFGTDVVLQYQKDGGEWTPFLSEARNTQTEFETYTVSGLEAGTYRFRIRTENLYLDNFEGFTLAASTAIKETWWVSYTFHYMNGGSEETLTDVEQMEIEFDGDNIAFNFPNPITGNAWMRGSKYQGEGPEAYVFPNGQYIGMYSGEKIYYCGSNGESLTDMVFYYSEDEKAFYDFEQILINGSTTIASVWAYFTDVAITKDKPSTTGISATLMNNEAMNNEYFDLQGRRVSQPTKGLYIVNGRKVLIK